MIVLLALYVIAAPILGYVIGRRAKTHDKNETIKKILEDFEIFDEPKDLSEFRLKCAPQSWQYVEEE